MTALVICVIANMLLNVEMDAEKKSLLEDFVPQPVEESGKKMSITTDKMSTPEKRSIKGLLLEIKISENYEMQILAEETLINKFTALESKLADYEGALKKLKGIVIVNNETNENEAPAYQVLKKHGAIE